MTPVLRRYQAESASVAVIRRGRIVALGAWGIAGPGRPAAIATPYNLASLTKPLTAEVVLRTASAGKLALDEPMDRYWSDPDLSHDPRRMALTMRLALGHRTGFPNWRGPDGLAFVREPGSTPGYSGEGYQYVARYAEHRTNEPFQRLAQRRLFAPTRMLSSGYIASQGATQPIATAYDVAGKPLPSEAVTRYNAADFAHATARDYAVFMIAVRRDLRISPSIAIERSRLQADQRVDLCVGIKAVACPPWIGFGLGWQLLGFPDGTIMMHTGKDAGAFTFAAIDRSTGDGIVIFSNSDNGWRTILPILELTRTNPKLAKYLRSQID